MDEVELARLVRAAITGDEKAYGDFLQQAACLVRNFASRKIVQGRIDPEDIVQEVLLAVLPGLLVMRVRMVRQNLAETGPGIGQDAQPDWPSTPDNSRRRLA